MFYYQKIPDGYWFQGLNRKLMKKSEIQFLKVKYFTLNKTILLSKSVTRETFCHAGGKRTTL